MGIFWEFSYLVFINARDRNFGFTFLFVQSLPKLKQSGIPNTNAVAPALIVQSKSLY